MDYSLENNGRTCSKEITEERMKRSAEDDILWEEFEEYRVTRIRELEEEINSRKDEIDALYRKVESIERADNPYKKHKLKESVRVAVLRRDKNKCRNCGSGVYLEVHHIIYRSQGGTDAKSNLMTLCDKCHADKHKGERVYPFMMKKVLDRRR